MRVRTDDNLYRVDRTWLGPKRFRFPWRATYQQYGLFFLIVATSGGLCWWLGVPINFVTVVCWLVVCILLARRLSHSLNADRSLAGLIARFGQELGGRRPRTPTDQVQRLHLKLPRWTIDAEPDTRRPVRAAVAVGTFFIRAGRTLTGRDKPRDPDDESDEADPWLPDDEINPWLTNNPTTPDADTVGNDADEMRAWIAAAKREGEPPT